jgi:hypothetical protein
VLGCFGLADFSVWSGFYIYCGNYVQAPKINRYIRSPQAIYYKEFQEIHRMNNAARDRTGRYALAIGVLIMIASVITGNLIQAEISTYGHIEFTNLYGLSGWARFLLFAFGLPLGLGVSALGLYGTVENSWKHRVTAFVIVLFAILSAVIIPLLFGRGQSAVFFGTGGYLILLMLFAVTWLWGKYRAGLPREARAGADLKGAGYLYFAIATWNLCGIGGMPSFALEPDRMIALGTREFATGQMKTVMALLLMGWVFTALGYHRSCKDRVQ